jgi:membrane protein DedA with SNARE-associated domain
MNVAELVRDYGYYAVIVGTFFEGELIMLAAGVAAAAGMLNLPGALAAGMFGIFCSDALCFALGRLFGPKLAGWFPKIHARLGGVFRRIEKHDEKLIVFFQFFPGLCTVTPVAFGMTKIPVRRFMLLDFAGNGLWTCSFTLAGYFLGNALEYALGDLHRWEFWLGGTAMVLTVVTTYSRTLSAKTHS